MRRRILCISLAASLGAFAIGTACAQQPVDAGTGTQRTTTTTTTTTTRRFSKPEGALSEDQIKAGVAEAGYKEVKGLEFKDGVWQAKARGGNRDWRELKIAPATGKVYPEDAPSKLDKDEIEAKLTAQGYTNIGHVKFDDGLWSAEAGGKGGQDYDLLIDPDDGSVVARSDD